MKFTLFLLLTIMGSSVHAQPIHRCYDSQGQITFQNRPCVLPLQVRRPAPVEQSVPGPSARLVSIAAAISRPGDRESQQRQDERLQRTTAARANNTNRPALLNPQADDVAIEHAGNRQRCQNAMRISALCGKYAGMFFCDDQGFRPIRDLENGTGRTPVLSNDRVFAMEQCALQAAQ